MRSEAEIQAKLVEIEAEADQYEDVYNDSFRAIQTLRWILGLPPAVDERRFEEDEDEREDWSW